MENITKIANYNLPRVGLFILFALPLVPSNIRAIAILFFGVTILALAFKRRFHFDFKFFLLNAGLYLSFAITVLYSDNMDIAIRKLEHLSALIVFPFIFALITPEERKGLVGNFHKYLCCLLYTSDAADE